MLKYDIIMQIAKVLAKMLHTDIEIHNKCMGHPPGRIVRVWVWGALAPPLPHHVMGDLPSFRGTWSCPASSLPPLPVPR